MLCTVFAHKYLTCSCRIEPFCPPSSAHPSAWTMSSSISQQRTVTFLPNICWPRIVSNILFITVHNWCYFPSTDLFFDFYPTSPISCSISTMDHYMVFELMRVTNGKQFMYYTMYRTHLMSSLCTQAEFYFDPANILLRVSRLSTLCLDYAPLKLFDLRSIHLWHPTSTSSQSITWTHHSLAI